VVLTSGKLYYDLLKAREDQRVDHVALVRLEQLYPVPAAEIARVLARYPVDAELLWAQEEPRNMGAWRFVRDSFLDAVVRDPGRRVPRYVGRPESAAPAPGSHKVHVAEQEELVRQALAAPAAAPTAAAAGARSAS
jgi:2-oxoglutarate dehydrogenase E1 component